MRSTDIFLFSLSVFLFERETPVHCNMLCCQALNALSLSKEIPFSKRGDCVSTVNIPSVIVFTKIWTIIVSKTVCFCLSSPVSVSMMALSLQLHIPSLFQKIIKKKRKEKQKNTSFYFTSMSLFKITSGDTKWYGSKQAYVFLRYHACVMDKSCSFQWNL